MKKILLCLATLVLVTGCEKPENLTTTNEEKKPAISSTSKINVGDLFVSKPTIEETVLYDDLGIVIKANNLSYKGERAALGLTFENNTDKKLSFVSGSFGYNVNSINSYMTESIYISESVDAGKTANDTCYIDGTELLLTGAKDISELQIGFRVTDDDYNEIVKTGPLTIKTSLEQEDDDKFYETMQSTYVLDKLDKQVGLSMEESFLQNDWIDAKECIVYGNDATGKMVFVIENKKEEAIKAYVSDISINGVKLIKGVWTNCDINVGKKSVITLDFDMIISEEYRDLFNLNTLGEVKFNLLVSDSSDDEVANDDINITFDANIKPDLSGIDVWSEDNISITYKGNYDKNSYTHLIFIVTNNSDKEIYVTDERKSLSLDNVMCDYIMFSSQNNPNTTGIIDVEINESNLEECGISTIDDVSNIQLRFEIKDKNYKNIYTPEIEVNLK